MTKQAKRWQRRAGVTFSARELEPIDPAARAREHEIRERIHPDGVPMRMRREVIAPSNFICKRPGPVMGLLSHDPQISKTRGPIVTKTNGTSTSRKGIFTLSELRRLQSFLQAFKYEPSDTVSRRKPAKRHGTQT